MRAIDLGLALLLVGASVTRIADAQNAPAPSSPTPSADRASEPPTTPPATSAIPTPQAVSSAATETSAPPADAASRTPVASFFLAPRPAPVDIGAFPPRPSPRDDARPRGIEVHGFVATWATPVTGDAPQAQTDAFRLRFAVLRVDARPLDHVTVTTRLGLMVPNSPLLDASVTYTPHAAFGITAGQFRLPIGAAATTLAPQLVMLDRPSYTYAMTKVAFRDVGVMFHSGPRGIANGLLHYRAVVASGGGRMGVGTSRPPNEPANFLYAGRILFEPSRLIFDDPSSRLVFGLSYARSHDPAIATGDAARDRSLATNILGRTLVRYDHERSTQIFGADLTLELRGVHAQAEIMYLNSKATDASTLKREAFGASLELAYTLPVHPRDVVDLQLAARAERFDPRFGANDEQNIFQLGMNAIAGSVRGSVFGTLTVFDDPMSSAIRTAGELTFRAAAAF